MKLKMAVFTNLLLALTLAFSSSSPAQSAPAAPVSTTYTYLPFIIDRTLLSAASVSAGSDFSCAITTTGGLMCWGLNTFGQLGDGTHATRFEATPVSGLSGSVTAISTGSSHACALLNTNAVQCWGYNADGELGNGTNKDSNSPVNVVGLSGIVSAISAGGNMTCALMNTGAVKCWGTIGAIASSIPVDFTNLGGTGKAISAGLGHICVLLVTGGVKCWGANDKGQLGNGTIQPSDTAVNPTGLSSGVSAISAGFNHTCAALTTGGAMCWGDNSSGQLGDGTHTMHLIPTAVIGLSDPISEISAGKWFTCALIPGGVSCWGINNYGQLGDGTSDNRSAPGAVQGLTGAVTALSAGSTQVCAVLALGSTLCWGNDGSGQVGDGSYPYRSTLVSVTSLGDGTTDIRAGASHTCALTNVDEVMCWGDNGYSQIGDNTTTLRLSPVDVFGPLTGISQISPGGAHSCALTLSGRVDCWGANDFGQLGVGINTSSYATPVEVQGFTGGVIAISSGFRHTCALISSGGGALTGGVKCWGDNSLGQLGDDNNEVKSNVPVDVTGLTGAAKAITTGWNHTCALLVDNTVMCWGENSNGQLGDGTTNTKYAPVAVGSLSGVLAISGGSSHTCALVTGGEVDCWGLNAEGQVGDGTLTTRYGPVPVSGISTASAISAGFAHSCAVLSGGMVKCWGANDSGQLGNGTTTNSNTPVTVTALPNGALVSAGRSHTCALTTTNTAVCWGSNLTGQLGIGVSVNRYVPVEVVRR